MRRKVSSLFLSAILILNLFGATVLNGDELNLSSGGIIYVDDDNTSGMEDGTMLYPYNTIQEGVNAAVNNESIYVFKGIYLENVKVDKAINLIGENRDITIIDGGDSGNVVYINADGVNISGFTVRNSGAAYPNYHAGIELYRVQNCTITDIKAINNVYGIRIHSASMNNILKDNIVSYNNYGIYIYQSRENIIINNTVSSNDGFGMNYCESKDTYAADNTISWNIGNGIHLSHSLNTVLINNNFLGDGVFIGGYLQSNFDSHTISSNNSVNGKPLLYYKHSRDFNIDSVIMGQLILINCTNVDIKNLQINDTDVGITVAYSSNINIINSKVHSNEWGAIYLRSISDSIVAHNEVHSNGRYGFNIDLISNSIIKGNNVYLNHEYGMVIWQASHNIISNNDVSHTVHVGIAIIWKAKYNLIVNNTVSNNDWGIIISSTSDNYVYSNNLLNNSKQASDNQDSNFWNHTYPLGGNYWSDYSGVDKYNGPKQDILGSDGIGDNPYVIDSDSQDNYPLMNPCFPTNQPPIAEAEPDHQIVNTGKEVRFYGNASYDPDGWITSYQWDFGDGSPQENQMNPIHLYNTPGNYTVALEVLDDDNASDTDYCIVTVYALNHPPIANAGPDQTVNEGDTAYFDSSGSYDPDSRAGVWVPKTDNPSPTWGCAAATLNNEIYYLGGIPCYPLVDPSSVFMKYNPTTDSWFNLPDLPSPRAYLGAAAANNKIYAIGGSEDGNSTDTVFEFDPTTNTWTSKSPMPVPIEAFGIATMNDRIYVIGGKSTWLSNNSLMRVYEYDPINDTWIAKPYMPTGRSNLACAVLEDKIYAIGGDAYGSTDAVEIYDTILETWTVKASMPSPRSGLCAEALQGKIYAFGGTEKWGLPTNMTEMYDPLSDSWTAKPSMMEPRVFFSSGVVGNCIYAMGGSYGPLIVTIPNSSEEYCVGDGLVYEWDFDASDGMWWETGAPPDATSPTPTHTYGDNGEFIVTLHVTDNDNLSATDICNVSVQNVNPIVSIESAIMDVEIGLRVAGRKYNNVSMVLYEEGDIIGQVSIQRLPGSPNEQMKWIPHILDMTKTYSATVTYEPEDPPNIGGNPAWIYIKFENGTIKKIHHTFNVQQSKKKDSEHWNHVEPWEVDLNAELIGYPFQVKYHITDPGSDDEILTFLYASQNVTVTYLNNPPNPDPFPSPEVKPVNITDTATLTYEGPETVVFHVEDDDGGLDSISIDLK